VLRVTTLYAASAGATAAYYTRYLAEAPGEVPGQWSGHQAAELGLAGQVDGADLQALLEGHDPMTGSQLGRALVDRLLSDGGVVRAVAGFDATFSAPKSLSVWWALTGDPGLLAAHDLAVTAALEHVERFGSTTRIRVRGGRHHPDTRGLSIAVFPQTTSRADDPQLHTHAVISAKVATDDGRWWALDARYLKRNQRMLGGLYQSVLRAELSHRYGIVWEPIVNGQAEIAGMPAELLAAFSKRTAQVDAALAAKITEFRAREGRDPTRWERAALTREASADTRAHKTAHAVTDLTDRWRQEAAALGFTPSRLVEALDRAARERPDRGDPGLVIDDVVDYLSAGGSTWTRADIMRILCDDEPPPREVSGTEWAEALEELGDVVIEHCVDVDPATPSPRRGSDGRSAWLEPTAAHLTSQHILAEEEAVLTWAMDAHADPATVSTTVDCDGLDVMQADAAAAVAGHDRLVVVVGPAGTGKTTMLRAAVDDLDTQHREMYGVAPTAKAARVLAAETGMPADTVAKLLHEWARRDQPPAVEYRLAPGTTLVVDEAGMIGTTSLYRLVHLASAHQWRLVLVGDPHQLQAVGRGGLFNELCATGRVHELTRLHRFSQPWEAAASLQLRVGDVTVLDTYEAHGRIHAGTFADHTDAIAHEWLVAHAAGSTVAITATTNEHVDALNDAVQHARLAAGQLDATTVPIGHGEHAHVSDIVATRRNDRSLLTSEAEPVRNRDRWTVTATNADGGLTVSHQTGHGTITLPPDYVREHVRLGYAATEHGNQADTVDIACDIVATATTHQGLYVGMTRGRHANHAYVVTDPTDLRDARDILETVMACDRADIPAVTQRRHLALEERQGGSARRLAEPRTAIPDWLPALRNRLDQQLEEHRAHVAARRAAQANAATELQAIQPALDAARAAWQPYGERIATLERELQDMLRPEVWRANHQAHHARFGHRHGAERRARAASAEAVGVETQIAAIAAEGAVCRQHLDRLSGRAFELSAAVEGVGAGGYDHMLDDVAHRTERLADALDTWTQWASGRPVSVDALDDAFDHLRTAARNAPPFALHADEVDQAAWHRLIDSTVSALGYPVPDLETVERPSLGLELDLGL
jgi:conjugative relaxase-like TrwC/TraI family protein